MSQGHMVGRGLTAQAAQQPSGMGLALRTMRWAVMLTQTAACLLGMSSRQLMRGGWAGVWRVSSGTTPGRELPFIQTPLELFSGASSKDRRRDRCSDGS